MSIDTLFVDPSRCIGCRACEAACRECDSHKGESMISVDFIDLTFSVATQPTVCMHCEDPVAPCAQVCPAMAILITPEGVVQEAESSRCIACRNCVYACPFGVPKIDLSSRLMKKCNLCYDRTSQGLQPWCAQTCPTDALWYGTYEQFATERNGTAVRQTHFGTQTVRTRVYHVLPAGADLRVSQHLECVHVSETEAQEEEPWIV
jgi:Fe-S-cluster-containing dehydrogenase component